MDIGGGSPLPTKDSGLRHGAFMEPSGRNRWQPVASGSPPKNGSNKPFGNRWQRTATVPERMVKSTFATACHRLPTTPYLLERESTSWLRKDRVPRTRRPAGLDIDRGAVVMR